MDFFKHHSFLILLVVSALIIVPIAGCTTWIPNPTQKENMTTETTLALTRPTSTSTTTTTTSSTTPSSSSTTTTSQTKTSTTTQTAPPPNTPNSVAFPNTLFIGDSRTEGLRLYGKITGATFFSKTSLNSFRILTESVNVVGVGTVTLEQLLQKNQYDTIYVMLGINEIGYPLNNIVNKYVALIQKLWELQPNAKIVIQSTIHVTAKAERPASGITNDNIDSLNERLEQLTEQDDSLYYIDLNPEYDNENGDLDSVYTSDGIHFYGKYYYIWRDHLADNRP